MGLSATKCYSGANGWMDWLRETSCGSGGEALTADERAVGLNTVLGRPAAADGHSDVRR